MLGWLWRLLTGRLWPPAPEGAFPVRPRSGEAYFDLSGGWEPEASRTIFRFWDGERERAVDPLIPWERWTNNEIGDFFTISALADKGDPQAMADVRRITCVMFDVQEFDGEKGLTRRELNALLLSYFAYMSDLKKKLGLSPTSFPLSASTPSTGEPSLMPLGRESFLTPDGSSDAAPTTT